jgi:hypothetical protein
MARYAGGGKTTVENCRSIDVLDWHRRGYLQYRRAGLASARSPRWFSWAWTQDGERVASINVQSQYQSVTLKYRIRSYGEDWSDVEQRVAIAWTPCRFGGGRPWFVFGLVKWGVLRATDHQTVRWWSAVRLPPLLWARIYESARTGPPTGSLEVAENPNTVRRQPKHVG